jgi:hypothetical protein
MRKGDHRFIRGNHDNPDACRRHPRWIADGHVEDGMMFVGGTVSLDRAWRAEGFDWWPEEELDVAGLKRVIDLYAARKPRIMVTHDCPEEVASIVLTRIPRVRSDGPVIPSRTRLAMQEMWAMHQPELWIFAHYHISFDNVLNGGREAGTRFICLAELEHRDVDVS